MCVIDSEGETDEETDTKRERVSYRKSALNSVPVSSGKEEKQKDQSRSTNRQHTRGQKEAAQVKPISKTVSSTRSASKHDMNYQGD